MKRIPITAAELCTPRTYAVEADLRDGDGAELEQLCPAHCAELEQWSERIGVTPTLGALMALLLPFHGITREASSKGDRRRLNGRGLQVPLRRLALVLGRHKSTVCDALNEGVELGFLERYQPTRTVHAITGGRMRSVSVDGRERTKLNTHGIVYLTPSGARALEGLGQSRVRVSGLRNRTPIPLEQLARRTDGVRQLRAVGVVGFLLTALAQSSRAVAARCASAPTHPTPNVDLSPERKKKHSVVGAPTAVGNSGGIVDARSRARASRAPTPDAVGARLDDLLELTHDTLRTLLDGHAGPESVWPEWWRSASPRARGDAARKFEAIRARIR